MSAATENMNNDPLAIFGEVTANQDSADHSESSSHVSFSNPFDPFGAGSTPSSPTKQSDSNNAPLDLLSQINSWGAQNHAQDDASKQNNEEKPVETAPKANVMVTKSNAIELSDDLVAEAHREFEATEDKLRKFEQEQSSLGQ